MKKKTLTIITLLVLMLTMSMNVFATSAPSFGGGGTFVLSITSTLETVSEGTSVLFRVSAKEIEMRQGLTTLSFTIDYPKDIVEPIVKKNINVLASPAEIKSFDEKTGKIVLNATKFITADTDILQVECKPKTGTTGKDIAFTLKGITGSNGSITANAVDVTSTVKIGTKNITNPAFKGEKTNQLPDLPNKKPAPIEKQPRVKKPEVKPQPKPEVKPKEKDQTTADKKQPNAGIEDAVLPMMIALAGVALIFTYRYTKVNNYKIKMASEGLNNLDTKDPMNIDIK